MSANTTPIFPKVGNIGSGSVATANTALDGTGTTTLLFTADETNGSRVDSLKVKHLGTNVATVLRLFINNGSTPSTAANNSLYLERTIAANTLAQTAESVEYDLALDLVLPPGYRLYASVGTTVAAGLQCTVLGGNY